MHEFSLDKPIVKDIVGSGRGNLNIDWVLDKMKIYWPGKIEIVNLKKKNRLQTACATWSHFDKNIDVYLYMHRKGFKDVHMQGLRRVIYGSKKVGLSF